MNSLRRACFGWILPAVLTLRLIAVVCCAAEFPLVTNPEHTVLDPNRLAGGGSVGSRALANQVNNPTAPVTLIQFRDIITPNVPHFGNPANLLQVQPVFPIFPSRLLPFDQLMKMTLPFPTTPGPGSETGLGDFSLFDVATFNQSWGKWGFGPSLVFPSATSTNLGQGKWQAGPAVAVIYTGVKNLTAGVVVENVTSFAGPSGRAAVNTLTITPTLTYNLSHGWFAGYSDFDWTFDWENGGAATIPLGIQAGKIFTLGKVPVSLSVEGAWLATRPSDDPDWLVCVEFTVIFPTKRSRH
jgi:hypothetical protein